MTEVLPNQCSNVAKNQRCVCVLRSADEVRPGVSLAVHLFTCNQGRSSRRDEWSILFLGQHLYLFPTVLRFTSVHQKVLLLR